MSSVDGKRRGLFAGACANCWHSKGAQCEFYGGKSARWDSEMDMCVHSSALSAFFRSILISVGRFFSKVTSGPAAPAAMARIVQVIPCSVDYVKLALNLTDILAASDCQ
jgi:hypothetical protein